METNPTPPTTPTPPPDVTLDPRAHVHALVEALPAPVLAPLVRLLKLALAHGQTSPALE